MAPSRKRKSDEMAEPTTPEASNTPAPKKMRITQTQKQALIDNLQLEIAERARHLRAHYALQCADLRSRIERRVNRIPISMRSITMAELMAKHEPAPAPPAKPITITKAPPAASRTTRKHKSSIVIAADPIPESSNENETENEPETRPKQAILPKPKTSKRPGSRTGGITNKTGAGILSPRSHNSRTLPRSPIKPNSNTTTTAAECPAQEQQPKSPSKHHNFSRPLSPLKPSSPLKSAATAATSAITSSMHSMLASAKSTAARGKAAASSRSQQNVIRTVSQASNHSAVSSATATSTGTVVKGAAGETTTRSIRGRAAAGAKKTAAAAATATKSRAGTVRKGTTAGSKKTVTAAAIATAEPAAGRRILRKRN